MIKRQYPQLDENLCVQFVSDLYRRGLITINQEKPSQHEPLFAEPLQYTTTLGEQFINFIQEPAI